MPPAARGAVLLPVDRGAGPTAGRREGHSCTSDPAWRGGWCADAADVRLGLRRVAGLMGVGAMHPNVSNRDMWRAVNFSSARDFRTDVLEGRFRPMEPDALPGALWRWQRADVSAGRGGVVAVALGGVEAKTVVLPIPPRATASRPTAISGTSRPSPLEAGRHVAGLVDLRRGRI